MVLIKFLFPVIVFLSLLSCVSDEERVRQSNSPYQGEWFGHYIGDDQGNINFKITNEGNIIGTTVSTVFSTSEDFLGYVQMDGRFDVNTKKGYLFRGFLKIDGHSSGQWTSKIDNNLSTGTYDFQKK